MYRVPLSQVYWFTVLSFHLRIILGWDGWWPESTMVMTLLSQHLPGVTQRLESSRRWRGRPLAPSAKSQTLPVEETMQIRKFRSHFCVFPGSGPPVAWKQVFFFEMGPAWPAWGALAGPGGPLCTSGFGNACCPADTMWNSSLQRQKLDDSKVMSTGF